MSVYRAGHASRTPVIHSVLDTRRDGVPKIVCVTSACCRQWHAAGCDGGRA